VSPTITILDFSALPYKEQATKSISIRNWKIIIKGQINAVVSINFEQVTA